MFPGVQSVKAQDVSSWNELKDAIQKGTTPINLTTDITNYTSEGLGSLFNYSPVTINGNGHDINGGHLEVVYGTFNINNVGSEGTKGFNSSSSTVIETLSSVQ